MDGVAIGSLVGRAGDDDLGGTDDAIVEQVAGDGDGNDRLGFVVGGRLLEDGLMEIGIEGVIQGVDLNAMILGEHLTELLANKLDAFDEAGGLGIFLSRGDGPVDVVDDGEQVAQEWQAGVADLIFDIALQPAADVFRLRAGAERLVLRIGEVAAELLEFRGGFSGGRCLIVGGWAAAGRVALARGLLLGRHGSILLRRGIGFRNEVISQLFEEAFAMGTDVRLFEFGKFAEDFFMARGKLPGNIDVDLNQ